jgi:hypothetical protein
VAWFIGLRRGRRARRAERCPRRLAVGRGDTRAAARRRGLRREASARARRGGGASRPRCRRCRPRAARRASPRGGAPGRPAARRLVQRHGRSEVVGSSSSRTLTNTRVACQARERAVQLAGVADGRRRCRHAASPAPRPAPGPAACASCGRQQPPARRRAISHSTTRRASKTGAASSMPAPSTCAPRLWRSSMIWSCARRCRRWRAPCATPRTTRPAPPRAAACPAPGGARRWRGRCLVEARWVAVAAGGALPRYGPPEIRAGHDPDLQVADMDRIARTPPCRPPPT